MERSSPRRWRSRSWDRATRGSQGAERDFLPSIRAVRELRRYPRVLGLRRSDATTGASKIDT